MFNISAKRLLVLQLRNLFINYFLSQKKRLSIKSNIPICGFLTSPGDFDVRTCIVVEASLDVCNCKVELDLSGWTVSSGDVTDCDLDVLVIDVLVIDGIEVENV